MNGFRFVRAASIRVLLAGAVGAVAVWALVAASGEVFFPIDFGLWGFDPNSLAICGANGGLSIESLRLVRPHCTNQTHFPLAYLVLLTSSCLTLGAAAQTAAVGAGVDRMRRGRGHVFAVGFIACAIAVWSLRYVATGYQVAPPLLFSRSLFSQPACRDMVAAIESRSPDVQGYRFWRSEPYWACSRARFLTDPVVQADSH